ncbi:tripartite tricarboxylate transporter TctB family protein [Pelagibius litoralis]|uniref:Tripartite tricarboxylate transporter TctB family protein n=1 Tax=Pelagibius litoralis TaxID=374515 RepID=A0A967F0P8_9PROT|nr:tripartite tricarboxylate transporter TctB family protein [Pelagibius litoralis]NIA70868.1 tripartite tricarboxylate transporter TctB family protein [Pelagibius litoralis]
MVEAKSVLGRWIDRAVALVLASLAIVLWLSADAIPPSFLDTGFGAGYLPKLLSVALFVLSGLILAGTPLRKPRHAVASDAGTAPAPDGRLADRAWAVARRPLALAVLLGVFVLAIDLRLLDSYVAAALFQFVAGLLLAGVSRRSLILSACCSILVTLAVYLLFTRVFTVILP